MSAPRLATQLASLKRCRETHGCKDNPATIYGHHASVRICIRLYMTDIWVYDPRWETKP